MSSSARRKNTYQFHFLVAGLLALAGTVTLWSLLSRQAEWPHWLGCWLITLNVLALGYYAYDKARARARSSRVPEAVLHVLAAAGGSIGCYAGMKLFRHKTIKGKFLIVFWCIVVLQVLLTMWVAKLLWWG